MSPYGDAPAQGLRLRLRRFAGHWMGRYLITRVFYYFSFSVRFVRMFLGGLYFSRKFFGK